MSEVKECGRRKKELKRKIITDVGEEEKVKKYVQHCILGETRMYELRVR